MREIPTTYSRKRFAKNLSYIITGWAILTIICVLTGAVTNEQVQMIGCTYDRWYIAMGMVMGIYTIGEVGAKNACANLNKSA